MMTSRCGVPNKPEVIDVGVAVDDDLEEGDWVMRQITGHHGRGARRNANGEAAIRHILSGTSSATRPALPATTTSTGLGLFLGGFHSACDAWGTRFASSRPASWRSSGGS